MSRIATMTDLMNVIALALSERDLEAIEAADRQTREWLVPHQEAMAVAVLIEAAREAIYELQGA